MPDQPLIVAELKRALRERGLTYAAVAKKLSLSLATVKRLFSRGDLSLRRIDQICELLETGLAEIAARARDRPTPAQLTLAQEHEIVSDPRLFLMSWLVLNRAPLEDIVRSYRFTEREALKYFYRLDELKIIELQPGNRVRLLVNRHSAGVPEVRCNAISTRSCCGSSRQATLQGKVKSFSFMAARSRPRRCAT
ncbi:MAG TPA: helix-turn-helix transcriptional regulator [Steroidobacteraceae bacterium]|jgi:transcriptional regulator with XRE-family HTH domain